LPQVLQELASATLELFDLARADVRAEVDGVPLEVTASHPGSPEDGQSAVVPLLAAGRSFGSLIAVRRAGAGPYGDAERELLRAFAAQAALALERARLDADARRAGFDAETSRLRASLFSSVTHDLRTPLASIKAGVTSLLDEDVAYDDVQRRELLRTILEETDRLNRLVGNILHLARVRAGGLSLAKELTPIDDVIEAVVRRMRPALSEFRVRTIVRPDLPAAWLDPVLIDQVMTNVLENAVRYSPRGGEITIAASPWHGAVRVRVADQGPGIPVEDRERVFHEFYGRESERARGGSGLGLAIARAVVAAHGGRIWIEGAPGGGTAVTFEIPVGSVPSVADAAGGEGTGTV
jgi:two-component system sensor histidine kinase KdpD